MKITTLPGQVLNSYASVFKNVNSCIFLLDEHYCLYDANPAAKHFFELDPAIVKGHHWKKIFRNRLKCLPQYYIAVELWQKKNWSGKCFYTNYEQRKFELDISVLALNDDAGYHIGYAATVNNIYETDGAENKLTAEKNSGYLAAETSVNKNLVSTRKLRNEKEKLLSLLQSTTNGFHLIDEDYKLILSNNTGKGIYEKITGKLLTEGDNILEHLPAERKKIVKESIDKAFSGIETEYEVEYKAENKWMLLKYNPAYDENEHLTGVCVLLYDITEKKKLEEDAYLKELKFSSAFYYSGIGMALVSPEGKWMDVNPSLLNIVGYTREELLKCSFQDITHPDDLDIDLGLMRKMLKREIETYNMEKRYIHKNGNVIWVMLTVSLVWNLDGSPNFFISQIVDISAKKGLIQKLENMNTNLNYAASALAGKIQQLEEFSGIVAHDLRGPAHAINLFIDNISSVSAEQRESIFPVLKKTSQGMVDTLNSLLKIVEVRLDDNIAFEPCNIRIITGNVIGQLTDKNFPCDMQIDYDLGVPTIQYPKPYMQSIIYNLLNNAIKYRRNDIGLMIKISTCITDGKKVLKVQDNGLGIDMEKNGNDIFRLKKTFHTGYDSKGIGLFIIKNQIEKLGGTITVESRPMRGSVFTISFD